MNASHALRSVDVFAEDHLLAAELNDCATTEWREGVVTGWSNDTFMVRFLDQEQSNSEFGPVVAMWTVWSDVRDELSSRPTVFVVDVSALQDMSISLAVLLGMIAREMERADGILKVIGKRTLSGAAISEAR